MKQYLPLKTFLRSSAVLTEQVFGVPGIGRLVVDAVFNRDYSVIQGVVLVTGLLYVPINLATDVLDAVINTGGWTDAALSRIVDAMPAIPFLILAPWLTIFPGAAIFLVVLGFNLMGDGLHDVLDTRRRARPDQKGDCGSE